MANITITPTGAAFDPTDTVTSTRLNEARNPTAALTTGSIGTADIADDAVTAAKLATDALELAYPVGSIYMNATVATNPATLLGFGTWVAFGAGRVPVGIDASQVEFNIAGETGGDKSVTLNIDQIPSHDHNVRGGTVNGDGGLIAGVSGTNASVNLSPNSTTTFVGGTQAHTNLQPYVVVYMWTRTA